MFYFKCPLLLPEYITLAIVFLQIEKGMSLMCLQCNDAIQPRHCHTITYCAEDEVCFVEKVESMYGVRYNVGCLQEKVCREQNESNPINNNGDGNHRPYTCTECCQSDLCNAEGCGQKGYPVARGPICFACYQHDNARECRQIAHCRDSELCYIKEEEEFGDQIYSTGCLPFQQCLSIVSNTNAIGDLSNSHHFTRSTELQQDTTTQIKIQTTSTPRVSSIQPTLQSSTTTELPETSLFVTAYPPTTSDGGPTTDSSSTTNHILTRTTHQHVHTVGKTSKPVPTPITQSTAVPTGITESFIHFIDETIPPVLRLGRADFSQFALPPVPKSRRPKRFTSCHQCCTGDLCNDVCGQNSMAVSEFLLAISKHKNHQNADNISLVVTSSENGKISIYSAYTQSFINVTISKGRNVIPMDPSQAVSIPWNEQKGIHILSNVNISVSVMENKNGSDTAFSVLPVSGLSMKYVTATAKGTKDNPSFITVVALQKDTRVRFDLHIADKSKYAYITPWRNYRYENGESFDVLLNQFETFHLEVNGTDLSGTFIEGTRPIAVLAGAESTVIPSSSCTQNCETQTVTQMIPPIEGLGTDFILPKLEDRSKFIYKVISSEGGTHVTTNTGTMNLTSPGSVVEVEATDHPISISSDKPILVVQMADTMKADDGNASGAMIVVPAVQQFQSDYHFSILDDSEYRNYISIMIKTGDEQDLRIDGNHYSAYNNTMDHIHLKGQSYTIINMPYNQYGGHVVENIQGNPFGLTVYGFKQFQGFGFPVGLKVTNH
ncbi:uncharacterized protein [Magallana gigas]|uniref:uncharacterized protein isoform X2 n=1 Tax=Magallana gigas TaxID=29159 RepID=UPI0033412167